MRKALFYITLFFSLSSSGQIKSLNDTLKIDEVFVHGRSWFSGSGKKMMIIDSTMLIRYSHDNISKVISENSQIFIKNYGPGGIASVSLRGTGPGYTQIAWNGVNMNSSMLGQTDLTLIPAGFIDDVSILYGGASLSLNNGGIGGIIDLQTKPVWKDYSGLFFNAGAGSFGRYSLLLKAKTGNLNFQSSTRILLQSAENNFTYLNNFPANDPVSVRRKNAGVDQNSFMQEFYFRKEKEVLSARIWYQKTARNIPVPIINQQPDNGESQKDEVLRTMINYSSYRGKTDYNTSLSWFLENLNYQNPVLPIYSTNLTNTIILKCGFETTFSDKTRISFSLNDAMSIVNSINYNGIKSQNLAGISASVRKLFGERVGVTALIRQTIIDHDFLIPDFSTGLDYRLVMDKDYFIKINVSHNSKVPTLNDLYWNPGGNSSLKNEYSYTGELIYEMNSKISSSFKLTSQLSLYMISIDNMIKWTPGGLGYWSPSNISKANSSGAEGNISLNYDNNSIKLSLIAKYAWNQARVVKSQAGDVYSGKQIVYTPEHLFNTGIRAGYKNYYFSWISCFTGKRYTSADNSDHIPGYFLNNVASGIKFVSGKNSFDININADNVFNVNYQSIAWYPMPGRSFNLSLIYQFGI